jgi:hypothetical protein
MLRWSLWLDDERFPPENTDPDYPSHFPRVSPEWRIARNFHDAKWLIETYGIPVFMSLDHDLGARALFTGMDFIKWFCDHLNTGKELPEGFRLYVHSQNPVGRENMMRYFQNFLKDGYWLA